MRPSRSRKGGPSDAEKQKTINGTENIKESNFIEQEIQKPTKGKKLNKRNAKNSEEKEDVKEKQMDMKQTHLEPEKEEPQRKRTRSTVKTEAEEPEKKKTRQKSETEEEESERTERELETKNEKRKTAARATSKTISLDASPHKETEITSTKDRVKKASKDTKPSTKEKVKEENDGSSRKKKKGEDEPVPRPLKYENLGEGPNPVPFTGRKYMGSHVSAAGGIWNAFENAVECKSKSFAIFLRNQRQWHAKPMDEETVQKWTEAMKDFDPHLILPHGSYLMNLGSPDSEILRKSRNMFLDELERCQRLGIPHYNFHPGSTTGKISREECCKLIAESINLAHSKTEGVICVLENMSCQGFTIGGDLHELRLIIEHVKDRSRVGICLDTCHAHAAGYDLSTEEGFQEFTADFEKIIGWQFLRGLHINDSKGKVGDHKDRHENIGKGTIGLEGFRRVMNYDHFNDLPLILETPWTSNAGYASEVKKLEAIIKK